MNDTIPDKTFSVARLYNMIK